MPHSKRLLSVWRQALHGYDVDEHRTDLVFAEILHNYSEPARLYHNLTHLAAMFDMLDQVSLPLHLPETVWLAIFFHDFICDPRAKDNEEQSAAHARRLLSVIGVSEAGCETIARMILLTKTHLVEADDRDGCALVDADLSILGAPPAQYAAYAAAVRKEYAWVPEDQYRAGRRQVLENFLARPSIFYTAPMRSRFEVAARSNIQAEIESLPVPS